MKSVTDLNLKIVQKVTRFINSIANNLKKLKMYKININSWRVFSSLSSLKKNARAQKIVK